MRFCILLLIGAVTAAAQTGAEDYQIYTEHPRLLLTSKRLRLLKRERERTSLRWNQFETLMRGKAEMSEPAFSRALYFQITGDAPSGRSAVAAALLPGSDTRQTALVWDWCQAAMNDAERSQLRARLERSLKEPVSSFASARDRVFAAIAIEDASALRQVVAVWWRQNTAPALRSGKTALQHADLYPFMEIAHVLRDNLQIDIRDDIGEVFRNLALRRILSYYPAPYPAAENEYHIPYGNIKGEPDLKLASLTRAGELALVAYESNAQEMQFLQGWLLNDRFNLRSVFGAPYEFLWGNPYQPGLPYEKLPLFLHDARTGTLLVRSSWEDDAVWLGASGSSIQMFREGQIRPGPRDASTVIGECMILSGPADTREFRVAATAPEHWYLLGMKPSTSFDIETDDEEMTDGVSDRGGILSLAFQRRAGQSVYVHEPRKIGE
jgi:hypothetical protein